MISRQLELGFENQPGMRPGRRSSGRSNRAHWWFEKMRGVVDDAREWPPAIPPPIAPRALAPPTSSDTLPPEAEPRSSMLAPPATATTAPTTPAPHRWRFIRARRLTWD